MWNKSIIKATDARSDSRCELTAGDSSPPTATTVNTKRLADMLEAIVGAFFVCGGLDSANYPLAALGYYQLFETTSPPSMNFEMRSESAVALNDLEIPEGYPQLLRKLANCCDEISIFAEYVKLQHYRLEVNLHHESAASMVESIFGYKFRHESLLTEAFTHPSVLGLKNNQRLEFLGDAVLDVAVVEFFFRFSNSYNPGELTSFKSAHTNNIRLGTLGLKLGFHRYLVVMSEEIVADFKDISRVPDDSAIEMIKQSSLHALADCFEALIGAIFLDSEESLATINDTLQKISFMDPLLS